MSEKGLPSLLDRHWAESALAIGAVIIAAVSLWMAYDTERTNRDLVASQSWPYVQVYESEHETDATDGPDAMSLIVANNGIGPAKLESFELFWNDEPQRSPWRLLQTCCVQVKGSARPVDMTTLQADIGTSSDEGIVLRAGTALAFLQLQRNAADSAAWDALHSGFLARKLSVRYCYCSAFDECWLATERFGERRQMNPPRVRSCPRPKVPYDNLPD